MNDAGGVRTELLERGARAVPFVERNVARKFLSRTLIRPESGLGRYVTNNGVEAAILIAMSGFWALLTATFVFSATWSVAISGTPGFLYVLLSVAALFSFATSLFHNIWGNRFKRSFREQLSESSYEDVQQWLSAFESHS
jgi:hypothetical protein